MGRSLGRGAGRRLGSHEDLGVVIRNRFASRPFAPARPLHRERPSRATLAAALVVATAPSGCNLLSGVDDYRFIKRVCCGEAGACDGAEGTATCPSCSAILATNSTVESGIYELDPDGGGPMAPF